jgi:hypothetical protein
VCVCGCWTGRGQDKRVAVGPSALTFVRLSVRPCQAGVASTSTAGASAALLRHISHRRSLSAEVPPDGTDRQAAEKNEHTVQVEEVR